MNVATVTTTATPGAQTGAPLLTVEHLRVEFAGRRVVHAVRGLSYTIAPGETLGLVGESGSGKSVSALALLGLLPKRVGRITAGSVRFEGRELVGLPENQLRDIRGARIAMIFQDPLSSLNPVLTIGRQITEGLETHRGLGHGAARARAVELLDLVGIPDARGRVNDYPHQFSGGMRQRASIAMALACEPVLLIADEPTTALDVTIRAQILDLLTRLRADLNMAILMITHDLGVVAGFADRLAVMYAGRIVETGPTEGVLARPEHPYTVGLLQSLPRLDRPRQTELKPIGGAPPDLASHIRGCPFAPRCAWRLDRCWSVDPDLLPSERDAPSRSVPAPHLAACHNRPSLAEAAAGRPLRPGFAPAPPPGQVVDAVVSASPPAVEETLVVFEEGTLDAMPVAADVRRAADAAPSP
ncbi:MAG: ABC transporter ATP-binding protein, partial [Chloroflexi bacterium]|nr:ABC transporter ATP-binding protein [Chloroflexota bacterium]